MMLSPGLKLRIRLARLVYEIDNLAGKFVTVVAIFTLLLQHENECY